MGEAASNVAEWRRNTRLGVLEMVSEGMGGCAWVYSEYGIGGEEGLTEWDVGNDRMAELCVVYAVAAATCEGSRGEGCTADEVCVHDTGEGGRLCDCVCICRLHTGMSG